jgi:sugar lactone lactonase YvrE
MRICTNHLATIAAVPMVVCLVAGARVPAMPARAATAGAGTVPAGTDWTTTAASLRGHNGSRYLFVCPAGGTLSGVWGTQTYTDDSPVCSAAVHAGRIDVASGGTVIVEIRKGLAAYTGSTRNGITSTSYGAYPGSYVIAGGQRGGSMGARMGGAGWTATAALYAASTGIRYTYLCPPGGPAAPVYGTGIFTENSSVCTAAVHAGLISLIHGGTVTIRVVPGVASYLGSTRHGVTTVAYTSYPVSFIFADSKAGSFAATPPARPTADRAYGQLDMSGTGTIMGSAGLAYPKGVAVDAAGDLYVADTAHNRVLFYAKGSTTASVVYGQQDMTGSEAGPIATGLHYPNGVAVDPNGGLYVADTWNNRVLYYTKGMTTTTVVRGQPSMTVSGSGTTATSLTGPMTAAVDASGYLYVSDTGNNRVLYFGASTVASGVYGQQDMTGTGAGISATGFSAPMGIAVDGGGGLYVADTANDRVLYFPKPSTTATMVYGQPDMASNAKHSGATGLDEPTGVAVDSSDGVYVADTGNSRVLYYPIGTTTATVVYGQPNMTGRAKRTSATGLNQPAGVAVDGTGGLYVADEYNSRVLHFPASGAARH